MKLVVFGGSGQVGRALVERLQPYDWQLLAPSRFETDICDADAVAHCIRRCAPDVVVNAAGYTAVDQAELDSEQAFAVNLEGARNVAEAAAARRLPLLQLSTDYVFDGLSVTPYVESDAVNPLGVYAQSKEAGERSVREATPHHFIVRTSWVFSPFGKNFVRTMLERAEMDDELTIVGDQTGCPTSALDLADAIGRLVVAANEPDFTAWGTYHYAGADAVSWYEFAQMIFQEAREFGVSPPQLRKTTTEEFRAKSPRPPYSALNAVKFEQVFGIRPRPLRDSLNECLARLLG